MSKFLMEKLGHACSSFGTIWY